MEQYQKQNSGHLKVQRTLHNSSKESTSISISPGHTNNLLTKLRKCKVKQKQQSMKN